MKKFFVAAAILSIGVTAFAGTVAIPFFLDNGSTTYGSNLTPSSGTASFIGLFNTTTSTISLTAAYTSAGASSGGGSFDIGPLQAVGFRPSVSDGAVENIVTEFPNSSATFGALVVTHSGGATDVVGRVIEANSSGARAYGALNF